MPQLQRCDRAWPLAGFSWKPGDAPVGVVDHDAVARGIVDLFDGDRGDRAALAVGAHERRDVDVGQGVAADDHEGVVGQQLAKPARAAGRAQQLLFEAVVGPQPERFAVAEVAADVVGVVVQVDADLGHAVARQQAQDVLHDRAIDDRRHRLGGAIGERRQPVPRPAAMMWALGASPPGIRRTPPRDRRDAAPCRRAAAGRRPR